MGGASSKPIAADLPEDVGAEDIHSAAVPPSDGTCLLLDLPPEILALIPESLAFGHGASSRESLRMMARLARTNRSKLHGFFQPILSKQKLLALVLSGQEAQAKAMIAANLRLLLERATTTTTEGRTYENVTLYEAALYAGDTQMCEMMHEFFKQLSDGDDERINQYNKVFPEGVDAVVASQTAYDFNAIINAISVAGDDDVTAQLNKEQNDSALCQAFNTFREEFTRLSQAEQHANLKHLLEVFTIYADDTRVDNWSDNKLDLFWRQVIGFVQCYLPACDKQVFHQGLYDVVENNERLVRLEEFKYGPRDSLRLTSDSSGVGFDFAAGRTPRPSSRQLGLRAGAGRQQLGRHVWKTYIEQKRQTCRTYAAADKQPSFVDSMK